MKGIDLSFWKDYPDWSRARGEVSFAIIAITECFKGIDWTFNHNYDGARALGIPIGAYSYSYSRSWADSKAKALEIAKHLNGRPLEMGVWLDLEWEEQELFPKALLTDIIEGFREGIEESGLTFAGIYCNRYWYSKYIPEYAKERYKFWVASYPKDDHGQVVEGLKPTEVKNLVGWQYSQNGYIEGFCNQGLDFDIWLEALPGAQEAPEAPEAPQAPQKAEESRGPYEAITLLYGNSGEAVRDLQKALNRLGYALDEDGIFGDYTKAAVKDYQSKNGLAADGIAGPLTWGKINNQTAALDVWAGMYGNGAERAERLRAAGYDPEAVQEEVNKLG